MSGAGGSGVAEECGRIGEEQNPPHLHHQWLQTGLQGGVHLHTGCHQCFFKELSIS